MAKITPRIGYKGIVDLSQRLSPLAHQGLRPQSDLSTGRIVIGQQSLGDIYGDDFLNRAVNFQRDIFERLTTGATSSRDLLSLGGSNFFNQSDPLTVTRLKSLFLASNATIDLRMFNTGTQREFAERFTNEVMQLGNVIKGVGLPAYSSSTSNVYNQFFNYLVNTTEGASIEEGISPIMTMLGRTSINVKNRFGTSDSLETVLHTPRSSIKSAQGFLEDFAQRKKNA